MRSILPRAMAVSVLAALAQCVWADPQSEARDLKEESLKILKATADRDAAPDEMAKCIFNLEKAAALLDTAHDTDSDLAKEVNSELYWARKRSTLAIDAALDKMRGVAGVKAPQPAKKVEPVKTAVKPDPNEPADPTSGMDDARKAFQASEAFARSHASDDYVVSLHWFQMASTHPGTDYALKALTFAREAQARFKSTNPNAKKEEIPDTPEMKLVIEADGLVKAKDYDKSVALYLASLKMKETAIAHRKLGQAYYAHAQQVKEEVIKKCTSTYNALKTAAANAYRTVQSLGGGSRRVFNPNDPNYQAALKAYREAYKEGDVAFDLFDKAQSEFQAVLKMAPKGKDLTAAGLIGTCIGQRPEAKFRARSYLQGFLKDYTPANDDDRTIYEYCKTELDRLLKAQ
ncbi:MAG TPA: hypothetical protein VKX17_27635 [Planctomycetota bacterium]|nr:hypothetical protein [Planctomycetota bacterium]